jgi:hypothetical protein
MISKTDRKELYEWIAETNIQCHKGLAADFRDGMSLMEILMHHYPKFFHRTIVDKSSAPSKCMQNWQSLRRNELATLRVTIPENGYSDELFPYYTGKSDENNRPYVEQLLWEVKRALNEFRPPPVSDAPIRRTIASARQRSQRKVASYAVELQSEGKLELPSITSQHTSNVSLRTRAKTAKKKEVPLPPIAKVKKYQVPEDEIQNSSWVDRMDGESDGKFFGMNLNRGEEQDSVASLKKKVKEMQEVIEMQQKEIKRLREASNPQPKQVVIKENVKFNSKSNSTTSSEELVSSITYIEDQSKEIKGKAWINVVTTTGKKYTIAYDETANDVKVLPGARQFKDPVESLEFDTKKLPLQWFI